MPRTKSGEVITWEEFFKRWKQGIDGVTPLQQVTMQVWSTIIMLIGLLCGIAISLFGIKTLWWLLIILIGGFGNTLVQLLGLIQKKNMLENFDAQMMEVLKGGN